MVTVWTGTSSSAAVPVHVHVPWLFGPAWVTEPGAAVMDTLSAVSGSDHVPLTLGTVPSANVCARWAGGFNVGAVLDGGDGGGVAPATEISNAKSLSVSLVEGLAIQRSPPP